MANDSASLLELLSRVGVDKAVDFLREGVEALWPKESSEAARSPHLQMGVYISCNRARLSGPVLRPAVDRTDFKRGLEGPKGLLWEDSTNWR